VVEGNLVAEQDVLALAGLVEEEGGAAADDVDAVIDEGVDGLVEGELLGLAVVDGTGRSWRSSPAWRCACRAG